MKQFIVCNQNFLQNSCIMNVVNHIKYSEIGATFTNTFNDHVANSTHGCLNQIHIHIGNPKIDVKLIDGQRHKIYKQSLSIHFRTKLIERKA